MASYSAVSKTDNLQPNTEEFVTFNKMDEVKPTSRRKRTILLAVLVSVILLVLILAVIIILVYFLVLKQEEGFKFTSSDKRHHNLNLVELWNSVSSNGSIIYTPYESVHRAVTIDNTFWLPVRYEFFDVIDLNGVKISTYEYDFRINGIIQHNHTHVIMATYSGLLLANLSGNVQEALIEGEMVDVSNYESKHAALDIIDLTVYIFNYPKDKELLNVTSFQMKNRAEIESKYLMTIMLYNDTLYICSADNGQIFKYNIFGAFITSYGKGDDLGYNLGYKLRPLYLSWPRVTGVDRHGSLLVTDKSRHTLRLLHLDGTWQIIKPPFLKNNYYYPSDFAVVDGVMYMAFRSGSLRQLRKYKI